MTVTNALCNTFLKDKRHEVPFVPREDVCQPNPHSRPLWSVDIGNGLGVVTCQATLGWSGP
jgi:hypothetical protein